MSLTAKQTWVSLCLTALGLVVAIAMWVCSDESPSRQSGRDNSLNLNANGDPRDGREPSYLLPNVEQSQGAPSLTNFVSRYTLAADLTIKEDHVRVSGLNVRGNVNVQDTAGVRLSNLTVLSSPSDERKGRINVSHSRDFGVDDNAVANEINVDGSEVFRVSRNTVGAVSDSDLEAERAVNTILSQSLLPSVVLENLRTIDTLITRDGALADSLGKQIQTLDRKSGGRLRQLVFGRLKGLGMQSAQQAETNGCGTVFHWLHFFLAEEAQR